MNSDLDGYHRLLCFCVLVSSCKFFRLQHTFNNLYINIILVLYAFVHNLSQTYTNIVFDHIHCLVRYHQHMSSLCFQKKKAANCLLQTQLCG